MSENDEEYCRLCAEPTAKTNLISPDEEEGVNSMLTAKMLWINIDITSLNELPSAVCFSCFDLLERTYRFLNTVRAAQAKLKELFAKKCEDVLKTNESDVGKPVDKDWEEFKDKKPEVKSESMVQEVALDSNALIEMIEVKIKDEPHYDQIICTDFDSSDEDDEPLVSVARKKFKKKISYTSVDQSGQIPILTWEEYTWRCGTCDASFQNVQSLRLHSLQIHTSCSVFKCNECGKNITSFQTFIKHVREHKKLLRYCCEFCNKCFDRTSYLKKHYACHKREFYLTCENCGSLFDTPDQMHDHTVIYTKGSKRKQIKGEIGDLKCDVCDKEFKSRSNLQQHKVLHTKRSRDFSCHVCGKMFFTKGTLSTHMMTHDDVKPFKCEHCSMSFRARGNLQSHVSLHSGVKPFVCEQCGKSFRVKRLLKSHYIVHTDLMPFVCEYCNKAFRFKTRLNLHLRQHTGAKPYNCIYCQRDFTNGSNYKKHMKRRHNIDTSKKKFNNISSEQSNDNSINNTT